MKLARITDRGIEEIVSVLLRTGVLAAGAIVLTGGIYFMLRHGGERADFHAFRSEPSIDRLIHEIVIGAVHLRARSVIQTGVLLLIATPILRVIFSIFGFALERDRTYVVLTTIVLAILMFSLISGAAGG